MEKTYDTKPQRIDFVTNNQQLFETIKKYLKRKNIRYHPEALSLIMSDTFATYMSMKTKLEGFQTLYINFEVKRFSTYKNLKSINFEIFEFPLNN